MGKSERRKIIDRAAIRKVCQEVLSEEKLKEEYDYIEIDEGDKIRRVGDGKELIYYK